MKYTIQNYFLENEGMFDFVILNIDLVLNRYVLRYSIVFFEKKLL